MKIHSVWANRTYSEEPELVTAWDEYSVDSNPEGYEEDWRKGLASWGNDLDQYRHVVIELNARALTEAFKPLGITAVGATWETAKPEPLTILPPEEQFTLEHSEEVVVNVHDSTACAGEHCTIHSRSAHSMRAFPQHWRSDRGIMERICPHGVGHPDPDSPWPEDSGEWVHGCDGCCAPK